MNFKRAHFHWVLSVSVLGLLGSSPASAYQTGCLPQGPDMAKCSPIDDCPNGDFKWSCPDGQNNNQNSPPRAATNPPRRTTTTRTTTNTRTKTTPTGASATVTTTTTTQDNKGSTTFTPTGNPATGPTSSANSANYPGVVQWTDSTGQHFGSACSKGSCELVNESGAGITERQLALAGTPGGPTINGVSNKADSPPSGNAVYNADGANPPGGTTPTTFDGVVSWQGDDGKARFGSSCVTESSKTCTLQTQSGTPLDLATLEKSKDPKNGITINAANGKGSSPFDGNKLTITHDNVGGDGGKTTTSATGVGDNANSTTNFADGGSAKTTGTGFGADGKPDDNSISSEVALGGNYDKFDRTSVSDSGDSDCKVSSGVNSRYGCKGTKTIIETSKVVNGVGQAVGSIGTAVAGQSAQQTAMSEGTQSAALRAAASTQETSGYLQIGAGTANVLAGALQMQRHIHHNSVESDFNGAKGKVVLNGNAGWKNDGSAEAKGPNSQGYLSSTGITNDIINSASGGDMNAHSRKLVNVAGASKDGTCTPPATQDPAAIQAYQKCQSTLAYRNAQFEDKKAHMKADIRGIANAASGEQNQMAQQALAGGMMSFITGAGQVAGGAFALASAEQLKQAADNLKKAEGIQPSAPGFVPLGAVNMQPGDPVAPGNGNQLNPSTQGPTTNPASTDDKAGDLGTLGSPLGSPQAHTPDDGPAPGAFNGGNPPGGGSPGGGGSGGFGGASTQASQPDAGDPQAKAAEAGKGAGYDGGGGTFGGGGGGGVAAERGPDLSGLLAQFLPKKDDEKNAKNILDFGGRNPASEGPISLLDRNANIFERVHETYQDKNRKGRVGL